MTEFMVICKTVKRAHQSLRRFRDFFSERGYSPRVNCTDNHRLRLRLADVDARFIYVGCADAATRGYRGRILSEDLFEQGGSYKP